MKPDPSAANYPSSRSRPGLRSLVMAVLTLLPAVAAAQSAAGQRQPRIGYVYPAGGQQGTTFTIAVGGQGLNARASAFFTPAGITAEPIGYDRPISQKEYTAAQEKLSALQEKRAAARAGTGAAWTREDEKMVAELRAMAAKRANRIATPALAETLTFSVTIPAGIPPGSFELRLRTPAGLSNPLHFLVGDLPEFTSPVITATTNPAGTPGQPRPRNQPAPAPARNPALAVALPAAVNGQIMPGETDRIRFSARKGQRLIIAARARELIPYLADAVPGWFQATLTLVDANGREVAYNDDFEFNPDPVIACEIPADGEYQVEIKDAIYRGREDFVYRIAIGELPFITSIFPLGARRGDDATFELEGWNLTQKKLILATRDHEPGVLGLSARHERHLSNVVKFSLGDLPEIIESEPNDQPAAATRLALPVVANGRIARTGDVDYYEFAAAAGDEVVMEVTARKLGSPLDSVIRLTDAAGREIGLNDDAEDKSAGLLTHHADSKLTARVPAAGIYHLRIGDAQQRGGPEYGYRLRVGPPEPDFVLRVTPASINVRGGSCVPITVHAIRRDGFSGEIALDLGQSPAGFVLSGGRIPAGSDRVTLTLAAPPAPRLQSYPITLRGTATIAGRRVTHAAIPADDQMQAFFYRHLVPASRLLVAINGRGSMARLPSGTVLEIPAGGLVPMKVTAPGLRGVKEVQCELIEPPEGIAVVKTSVRGDTLEVQLSCDAKVKAGLQGNLLFQATGVRETQQKKGKASGRVPLMPVPAVPFRIAAAGA